jgi:hypothetical protein
MNSVTAKKFTGRWTPPVRDTDIQEAAENQSTTTAVLFGIELKHQDQPDLIVSNIAANTSAVFHLDPNLFSGGMSAAPLRFAISLEGPPGGQGVRAKAVPPSYVPYCAVP